MRFGGGDGWYRHITLAMLAHAYLAVIVNYRLKMRQKLQVKIEPPVSCSATLSVDG